jgi:hypothetical protein
MAAQSVVTLQTLPVGGGASDTTSSPALAVHLITTVSSDTGRRGSETVSRARKKGHATTSAEALPLTSGIASPSSAATAAGKLRVSVGCVHVVPSRNSERRRHEKGAADDVGVAVGAADGDARALTDAVSESDRLVAVGETAPDGDGRDVAENGAEGLRVCSPVAVAESSNEGEGDCVPTLEADAVIDIKAVKESRSVLVVVADSDALKKEESVRAADGVPRAVRDTTADAEALLGAERVPVAVDAWLAEAAVVAVGEALDVLTFEPDAAVDFDAVRVAVDVPVAVDARLAESKEDAEERADAEGVLFAELEGVGESCVCVAAAESDMLALEQAVDAADVVARREEVAQAVAEADAATVRVAAVEAEADLRLVEERVLLLVEERVLLLVKERVLLFVGCADVGTRSVSKASASSPIYLIRKVLARAPHRARVFMIY